MSNKKVTSRVRLGMRLAALSDGRALIQHLLASATLESAIDICLQSSYFIPLPATLR